MESTGIAMPKQIETLTDEDIVGQVRSGDTSLFEIIIRRYNQRLFRVARAILKNDTEAEDVVQEAYVRAYTNLHQFAGEAKFSTWLTRIAIHECFSRIRRNRRFTSGDDVVEERMTEKGGQSSPEEQVMTGELREVLESVIETLPSKYRVVFVMRELQGMDTEETSESLQISEEAVKSRLFRARALLRKRIDSRIGAGIRRLYEFDGERCDRIVQNVMRRVLQPI